MIKETVTNVQIMNFGVFGDIIGTLADLENVRTVLERSAILVGVQSNLKVQLHITIRYVEHLTSFRLGQQDGPTCRI